MAASDYSVVVWDCVAGAVLIVFAIWCVHVCGCFPYSFIVHRGDMYCYCLQALVCFRALDLCIELV